MNLSCFKTFFKKVDSLDHILYQLWVFINFLRVFLKISLSVMKNLLPSRVYSIISTFLNCNFYFLTLLFRGLSLRLQCLVVSQWFGLRLCSGHLKPIDFYPLLID